MNHSSTEAGIPVLTEVIPNRPAEPAEAPPAPAPAPAIQDSPPAAPPQERLTAEWNEAQWLQLEREVRERVLQQVLERIDFVLEQRVRDSLADVLQLAVEGLAADIRSGLHRTVKEVVTRAVTQEVTKLRATKK